MEFVHSGKLGDVVFSLPAFTASGATEYILHDPQVRGFWRYAARCAVPLLESQGIRCRVLDRGGAMHALPTWINGDGFRTKFGRVVKPGTSRFYNLAERQLLSLGFPVPDVWPAWLHVVPRLVAQVVFVRSPRYRPVGGGVDWLRLATWAAGRCVFLGLQRERDEFCAEYGVSVPWYETRDYLDAAQVMSGARLVVANQTGLQAVASGLAVPQIIERCEGIDWCRFDRELEWVRSDDFFSALRGRGGLPLDQQRALERICSVV